MKYRKHIETIYFLNNKHIYIYILVYILEIQTRPRRAMNIYKYILNRENEYRWEIQRIATVYN